MLPAWLAAGYKFSNFARRGRHSENSEWCGSERERQEWIGDAAVIDAVLRRL
jgi:hypothetical protein